MTGGGRRHAEMRVVAVLACLWGLAIAVPGPARAAGAHRRLSFGTVLFLDADQFRVRSTALPSGPLDWGTVLYRGTTDIEGMPFDVEVTGVSEQRRGTGPFRGTMLLSSPTRGSIGFAWRGAVAVRADGTRFVHGRLDAISGTGEFADTAGRGRVRGTRDAAAGSPVTATVELDLVPGRVPRSAARYQEPREARDPNLVLAAELSGVPEDQHFASMPHERTFGTGRLTGTADDGSDVGVELLANVDDDAGSGPFQGFVNLVASDGSLLGMRYFGKAERLPDGSTAVHGQLVVIAAEGRWAGQRGRGDLVGARAGVVGAPLEAEMRVRLRPGG